MRIEPTTHSLPRQSLNRRHRTDAQQSANTKGTGAPGLQNSLQAREPSGGASRSNDIIALTATDHPAPQRLSSRRWRSHVPFIAQYIGQETAIETPERTTRRHSETASQTYRERVSPPPSLRTVARV